MQRIINFLKNQNQTATDTTSTAAAATVAEQPRLISVEPADNNADTPVYSFRYCVDDNGNFLYNMSDSRACPEVNIPLGFVTNSSGIKVFSEKTHATDIGTFLQICKCAQENPETIIDGFIGYLGGDNYDNSKAVCCTLVVGITRDNIAEKMQNTVQVFANKAHVTINLFEFKNENDFKKDLETPAKTAKFMT